MVRLQLTPGLIDIFFSGEGRVFFSKYPPTPSSGFFISCSLGRGREDFFGALGEVDQRIQDLTDTAIKWIVLFTPRVCRFGGSKQEMDILNYIYTRGQKIAFHHYNFLEAHGCSDLPTRRLESKLADLAGHVLRV